jgi:outer membrane lipoprotein-sorting protein
MRPVRSAASGAALALPLLLAGCSLFPTTRYLPVPKTPALVQTATPAQLVAQLNEHWDALKNLTATVEIQATELKSAQGVEKAFPSARGYIIISKPNLLRVAGTYFDAKIFDMASNENHFTLVIPSKGVAIEGTNTVTEKSANPLENLRPDFFFDAIVVRGLEPDESYMVSADSETIEDPSKKHLYFEPEYVLSVMHRDPNDHGQFMPVRQVTFHRDDMRPYEQDLYDAAGTLNTVITYSNYADFSAGKYPSRVVIKRPIEGIELTLTVDRVQENVDLPADEFQVKIPPDY